MDRNSLNGLNIVFPIYNEDGTPFHNLVLRKSVVDSIVMSLGDKITGDVYYKDNTLAVTMQEYIEYKQNPDDENELPVRFVLVNPPTIVREGMASDNSELKGMTKYSFEFYHPMCQLSNFPFTDVATKAGEEKYLSQNKTFSWIGKPQGYIDKLNKNLKGTQWYVRKSSKFPQDKDNELSEVLTFDNVTIADAIKIGYETWDIPYIVSQLQSTDPLYAQGKRFVIEYGLPSNEIYESDSARQLDSPFVFHMGQGVGLKNNSRTPRNNKIVTRIAGYGSEDNVPYGYPQIVWTGNQDWDYTVNNDSTAANSYPIYKGIVGGQYVKLIKHPFTRTHLMPSIYTETVNKKVNPNAVGYNPNIEIKDYYDAIATQEYPYTNEINPQAPSYESHEFADIKPELDADRNTGIVSAVPLNADLTPADHWDDSMDDNGKYLQEYFKITLPQLSFDLYACAAITQEMQINMRSGDCIGCTFPIQVDWDDYKRNFYDEDGNFVPDGEQRDLTKYPKSNLGQISVVVQKENSTFGTLMPNIYQQPQANDLFVFIGISLPLSYIANAEERLDDAMKTYMLENNVYYFDYPLKFDEHFLATHTYILEQIRPNSIIHFDYGGVEQQLFVKQLTVKYGNAPLPQYDITLTDNIEVVLNQIGQVADDVERLSSLISVLRQSYSRNVWTELAKKLSKTQDDTAQGYIRFIKGLQVGSNFVPDILGEGGVLRMRDDGKVELVTDILYARVKAYFDTVEIREYKHTAGNRIASVAGNKCVRVAWFNSSNVELEQTQANLSSVAYFRCFFRASDGEDTVRNNFSIGDQAYCHVTSIATGSDNPEEKGLNQKHFWRLVIGRNTEGTLTEDGEAYIDLSNRATETIGGVSYEGYQSGSDVPQPQDDIIQLGNVNDATRQGAIVEYVTGTDAPSYQIYQGINSFSLNGKNQIGFGYNTATGRAYMNVYGDFRFGSRNNNGSYIKYNSQTGNLEIKAHVEFTNSDAELDTLVQEHQRDDSYDDSWIQPALDELQDQIDGQIDSWFYNYSPVHVDAQGAPDSTVPLNVEPYSDWDTDDKKIAHLGDTFTNNTTGYCWRFSRNSETNAFEWVIIEDSAVITALQNAARAQETADGKRTTYSVWGAWVKNNVNTLKKGDLFIPAADTTQGGVTYKARKVYKCTTDGSATFSEINYTDDTYAHNFDYLKAAMKGDTQIQGGLLLSNAVVLRNVEQGVSTDIMSGINGVLNTDLVNPLKSIAAWYGGDMLDREAASDSSSSSSEEEEEPRYATSLFRFDGSGYLASGNITWNDQGQITIKNITTLSDSQNTNLLNELATFNSAFHFTTGGQGGTTILSIDPQVQFSSLHIGGSTDDYLAATRKWVGDNYISKTWFNKFFKVHYKNNGTDAVLDPNNDFPAGATDKNIEAIFSFWTNYAISALGQGVDGSHAIGSLDDLSDVELTSPDVDQILKFDGTHWVNADEPQTYVLPQATANALGGIKIGYNDATPKTYAVALNSAGQAYVAVPWTDHYAWGDISNKPTTISGYGITDAYTKAQVDSLVRLKSVALASDGVLAFELQDGSVSYADLTHQHDFQEILERPTTIAGYGITDAYTKSEVYTKTESDGRFITKEFFETLFNALDSSGVKVNANSTSGIASIKAMFGFWTEQYISALGQSSGGGGGVGDVTWETLADNTDTRQIALSHLTTALTAYATQSWVTALLSSYATQSWVTTQLASYATQQWVISQGYTTNVGTVTSLTAGTGLSGGTITSSGTIAISSEYQEYINNGNTAYGWGNHALAGYATQAQLNALEYLNQATGGDGVMTLTTNKGNATLIDLTHEHSWFEIQDRPTTLKGLGISADDELLMNNYISIAFFRRLFQAYNGNAEVLPNDTASAIDNIKAMFGFWTEQYLTALGRGSDSGGGGQGDVTWALLAQQATNNRTIHQSYIADILSNYATTSWVTGLNYATQTWVEGKGYATTTQLNALEFLSAVTGGDGFVTLTTNKNNSTILDLSHEHSWFELLDRPDTLAGYGVTLTADDIPNIQKSKISDFPTSWAWSAITGKPTTVSGYGITDAITTANIGSQSVRYAASAGSAGSVAWSNVSGRPTAVSSFTNDSGYITSSGSCNYATSAGSATSAGYASSAGNADTLEGYHYSSFLLVSGGDMNSGARISFSGGNGYLGNASNAGWLMVQDMCSQNSAGDGVWSIRTNGNAIFQNVTSYGSVSALSDIRHKEIVCNTNLQVEQIAAMRSVIYRKKDSNDNTLYAGSIAQDWQSILPQVVSIADNDEHTQSLQYGVAALLSTIAVAKKVVNHEQRIKELEEECERLRTELLQYKTI